MSTAVTHDLLETIISSDSLSTLNQAIKAADMGSALKGKGPLTIFAPTNEAFKQIPKDILDSTLKNKPRLESILKYHVVSGKHMASEIVNLPSVQTLQGESLRISTEGGCRINDASVVNADIECTNGVIHLIDTVLMPE
ncbi:MAG TPA: fasciclin domain-containing protein [Thermoguttaceae bacterium]|nr:fasciclin domain-containing protein [Thermoguttaceae bacterium]